MRARFIKSLRGRLLLWLAFLLVCVLSGFGVAMNQLSRLNQFNQLDEELDRRIAAVGKALRGPPMPQRGPGMQEPGGPHRPGFDNDDRRGPPPEQPPGPRRAGEQPGFGPPGIPPAMRFGPHEFKPTAEMASLFDETRTNSFYYAVWSGRDRNELHHSTNLVGEITLPREYAKDTRTRFRIRDEAREAYHFTERGDCILVGSSITADLKAMRHFTLMLIGAGLAVLGLGLAGGWLLTSRAIQPVTEISAAASRISGGNLAERITVADTDSELGKLAEVLNSTFARLDAAFAQQRQFTADAAHELRTPLAVIVTEAQTTLARERSPAEYRETIAACLDAAQQMRRLSESLLQLARFDGGHEPVARLPFDLADSAQLSVERIRPLAEARGIRLECNCAPAPAAGDVELFNRVITNLLGNAVYYNVDRGEIRVGTFARETGPVLTVTNTGPGIAAEDLPHIFERFYRGDKSRARADGRSGLGLAISHAIVTAHGGNITAESEPDGATTFTVRLPAARPEDATLV